jgi:hypothetical protein
MGAVLEQLSMVGDRIQMVGDDLEWPAQAWFIGHI